MKNIPTNPEMGAVSDRATETQNADYWAARIAASIQMHANNGLLTQDQADELKGGLN